MFVVNFVTVLAFTAFATAAGGFGSSCLSLTVNRLGGASGPGDVLLTASCNRRDGSVSTETIGLNSCLGNNNGRLGCQHK